METLADKAPGASTAPATTADLAARVDALEQEAQALRAALAAAFEYAGLPDPSQPGRRLQALPGGAG